MLVLWETVNTLIFILETILFLLLPGVPHAVRIFAALCLMLIRLYCACQWNRYELLFHCARMYLVTELVASFCWQVFYFFSDALGVGGAGLAAAALAAALATGLYYTERFVYRLNSQVRIAASECFGGVIIAVVTVLFSNLGYLFGNTLFSDSAPEDLYKIRTLAVFSGMVLLMTYYLMVAQYQKNQEVDSMKKLLQMQRDNYRMAEQSVAMINRKYHDMKHQIAILRMTVNSAEKTKYLDRIEDEIKSYEIQYDTGHRVLDTILTGKSLLCQEQGITLTCVADGHLLDFMDEMNICVLFGNALDNAMESVGKLADQSKRLIHVSVARKKCFACIQIENCFAGEVQFVDGLPKTTKADAGNHGIGLKSIRQIVAEYDGAMTASTRGQWFELNLMIPLKTAM